MKAARRCVFENRISDAIKLDIQEYFKNHKLEMRNESSIQSNYYKLVNGEFEARLVAKDKDVELVSICISVPTPELAASICNNWQKKNKEIYQYLTEQFVLTKKRNGKQGGGVLGRMPFPRAVSSFQRHARARLKT